jgi:hypothetical protein
LACISSLNGAGEATIGGVVRRVMISPARGSPVHAVRKSSPQAAAAIRLAVGLTVSFMASWSSAFRRRI